MSRILRAHMSAAAADGDKPPAAVHRHLSNGGVPVHDADDTATESPEATQQRRSVCCVSTLLLTLTHKHIHLVGERFILEIHQNSINYSYTVDVSVSYRYRNVDNVRIKISCVLMNF